MFRLGRPQASVAESPCAENAVLRHQVSLLVPALLVFCNFANIRRAALQQIP